MSSAGVVTVADLLNRNPPVPVRIVPVEDTAQGISVGHLLRREGRAPHALDRPIQPRAHQQQPEEAADAPAADRIRMVRRGAITAGALLAAGSVVGAALLTEVTPAGSIAQDPPTGGPYPGQGLLDPDNPLVPSAGAVQLDQAASVNPLDAGAPAPTSWMSVAFPGALAGVPAGTSAAAAADAAAGVIGGGSEGSTPLPSTGGTGSTGGGGGGSSTPPAASTGGGGGDAGNGGSGGGGGEQGVVGDLGDGLGGAANDVGDTVGGPVGDTVGDLGDTVDDTAGALDDTVGGLLGDGDDDDRSSRDDDSDDDDRSARSSSDDDSSSSSAPRHEESSDDDEGSRGSSRGLVGTVGDIAGGLLG